MSAASSSSYQIRFGEVSDEYGAEKPLKASSLYRGGARVPSQSSTTRIPTSGPIRMSDFMGTWKTFPSFGMRHRWTLNNTMADSVGGETPTRFYPISGVMNYMDGGMRGRAMTNSAFYVPLSTPLSPPWSLSWWVTMTLDAGTSGQTLAINVPGISTGVADSYQARMTVNTTPQTVLQAPSGTQAPIEANRWYHFVLTVDSVEARMYMNGSLLATAAMPSALTPATYLTVGGSATPTFGPRTPTSGPYHISDFIIYRRVISAEEVLAIYGYSPPLLNTDRPTIARIFSHHSSSSSLEPPPVREIYLPDHFVATSALYPITAYSIVSNPNGNATIDHDSNKLLITPRPDSAASYSVTVAASNAVGMSRVATIGITESLTVISYSVALAAIPGLIHRYKFEDSLADSVGSAHGTPVKGGVRFTNLYGKFKSAMISRGGAVFYPSLVDSGAVIPNEDSALVNSTNAVPWSVSYYFMTVRGSGNIIPKTHCMMYNMSTRKYYSWVSSTSTEVSMPALGGQLASVRLSGGGDSSSYNWTHAVVTSSTTSMSLYINGTLESTTTDAAYLNRSWDRLYVGCVSTFLGGSTSELWTPAPIAEVCIFNRALTAAEVQSLSTATVE